MIVLDRLGNEVDFTELFMEETLSAKDRKELDDSMYGIVYTDVDGNKVRKYPLNDEKHVLQAVRFFNKAEEKYKPELARNIVKRAKELDMEWENWDVLKPYLDKPVKESYDPDPYSISGTSDFDEYINDDEYYGEADQALMNQIQKNEDNIPLFQLRTYAKNHLSKRSVAGTTELIFKIGREYTGNNSFEKRCNEYFLNLISEIDKCIKKSGDKISAVKKPKWFFYERKIKQLFNLIGVDYAKDRVLSYISGNRGIISFEEKESIKYTYDPNTDILIHRSRQPNINMLIPSHESRDGIVYPRPRIYCYLEQRADFRLAAQDNGQYGDNVYEIVIPKSITVFRDMEYGKPHDNSKYAKEVFINTNVPLKAKPITYDNTGDQINQQQTESQNMSPPPPIQESFNEMFGEKVSLKNMYQESSTDMMKVNDLECDELYFGSDTKYPVEIDLNRPLFVTPLKGIASIFAGSADLKGIIPKGSYNLDYKEWRLPDKELMKPLKTVHVYVEGYPDLKEQEITLKGYIHCIPFKYYKDNIYRYPWMSKGVEYLIANTENMKVEFTRIIECEVKYIVKGVPSDNPKYGPDLKGYLELAKHIAKKISIQVKNDSKPPTGNQNCQLCTWCAEAQFRGMKVLPRPVYSPRDPVFKIVGENIVHQPRCISLKQGYDDFLDHLMDVDTTFARWYCHVNWKGSTGGHEFMLLKIDKKFYIMDPQSGKVETLDDTHKYFEDINWDNSYVCRFDNKAFNHELLEKTNDPKKTLPWDPKKDIPYMVKHGMCTKEEAEKELKKTETDLFTSELKKALNQTHIQESASDQTPIQEGLFSNSKEHIPTISDNFEEFTRAYNDPIFKSIIEDFKNMKSKDLKKYYDKRFPVNERDDWMKDNFDGTVVSFEKNIDSDLVETDNRYNPIGYMFATVKNQDEWLSISMLDGCVYYCNIRDNSKVSSSFNEFLKSFNGVFDKYLKDSHIQESASDPMTIIPKDLRDWLKKGDYSSLEKDDAYYYVEGHPVEEFWSDPEFARSAFYLDDKNDPSYNSIVFSDDNGNGLIYDPTDGWYYYLYHDWTEDDTGFLHRERLSSKSWTQIIDPTHSKSIKDSDEKRSKISKELTHLKANPIYDDIEYGATNSHFGKGFFKSDCSTMEKRWNAIGHEWCNAVEDFADKYKFPELSEAIDIFANKTMSLFVPTIGSHGYDIEAYKEGAKNVIKAFQDVEKSLKERILLNSLMKR